MKKHAYLIIAHKDDLTFRTLVNLLDDEKNDLFIHMDKKLEDYDSQTVGDRVSQSNVFRVGRTDVAWGGYSQINAELLLLKEALKKGDYRFYHLLSGEDLPLKKNEEIHQFFDQYPDKNFVSFQGPTLEEEDQTKVKYYHYFQDQVGRLEKPHQQLVYLANLQLQKLFRVDRHAGIDFQKGANWFSINGDLAPYVVGQEAFIEETFQHTRCADEMYMHTLIHNSPFKETLYRTTYDGHPDGLMRLIDWDRGQPYTFRRTDLEELTSSPYPFARKFNAKVDSEIILELKAHLS